MGRKRSRKEREREGKRKRKVESRTGEKKSIVFGRERKTKRGKREVKSRSRNGKKKKVYGKRTGESQGAGRADKDERNGKENEKDGTRFLEIVEQTSRRFEIGGPSTASSFDSFKDKNRP